MSVVVYQNEPIENALKRLHREVMIEGILDKVREKQHHIKKSEKNAEKKRIWAKTKKRRRAATRKLRRKGINIL